jgi:hypothetical protein
MTLLQARTEGERDEAVASRDALVAELRAALTTLRGGE